MIDCEKLCCGLQCAAMLSGAVFCSLVMYLFNVN